VAGADVSSSSRSSRVLFLHVRPQQRKAKEHRALIAGLRARDRVVLRVAGSSASHQGDQRTARCRSRSPRAFRVRVGPQPDLRGAVEDPAADSEERRRRRSSDKDKKDRLRSASGPDAGHSHAAFVPPWKIWSIVGCSSRGAIFRPCPNLLRASRAIICRAGCRTRGSALGLTFHGGSHLLFEVWGAWRAVVKERLTRGWVDSIRVELRARPMSSTLARHRRRERGGQAARPGQRPTPRSPACASSRMTPHAVSTIGAERPRALQFTVSDEAQCLRGVHAGPSIRSRSSGAESTSSGTQEPKDHPARGQDRIPRPHFRRQGAERARF